MRWTGNHRDRDFLRAGSGHGGLAVSLEKTGAKEDWAWRQELNRNREDKREDGNCEMCEGRPMNLDSVSQTQELGLNLRREVSQTFASDFLYEDKSGK